MHVPGTVRGWILPPWEGGPVRLPSCQILIACHGEAPSPGVGRAVYAPIPEVSFSCLLILLRLARLADMVRLLPLPTQDKTADEVPNVHRLSAFLLGIRKKPYMSAKLANRSNVSRQLSFFLGEEEALHASQTCQVQQYQQTAKGNLWDWGIHTGGTTTEEAASLEL